MTERRVYTKHQLTVPMARRPADGGRSRRDGVRDLENLEVEIVVELARRAKAHGYADVLLTWSDHVLVKKYMTTKDIGGGILDGSRVFVGGRKLPEF